MNGEKGLNFIMFACIFILFFCDKYERIPENYRRCQFLMDFILFKSA